MLQGGMGGAHTVAGVGCPAGGVRAPGCESFSPPATAQSSFLYRFIGH